MFGGFFEAADAGFEGFAFGASGPEAEGHGFGFLEWWCCGLGGLDDDAVFMLVVGLRIGGILVSSLVFACWNMHAAAIGRCL